MAGASGTVDRFDRVIAWTTPQTIPAEWIRQAAPNAAIVTPVT
jgi:hypothetical protein